MGKSKEEPYYSETQVRKFIWQAFRRGKNYGVSEYRENEGRFGISPVNESKSQQDTMNNLVNELLNNNDQAN